MGKNIKLSKRTWILFFITVLFLGLVWWWIYRVDFSPRINLMANLVCREDESKEYMLLFPFSKESKSEVYMMGIYKEMNRIIDFSVLPVMFKAKINAYRRYELSSKSLRMEFVCYLTRKGRTGIIDKLECYVIKSHFSKDDDVIWKKTYKVEQNLTDYKQIKKFLKIEFVKMASEFAADIETIRGVKF